MWYDLEISYHHKATPHMGQRAIIRSPRKFTKKGVAEHIETYLEQFLSTHSGYDRDDVAINHKITVVEISEWRVYVKCAGQCDFEHEWVGNSKDSLEAKQQFLASLGNKDAKYIKHLGHNETRICKEVKR